MLEIKYIFQHKMRGLDIEFEKHFPNFVGPSNFVHPMEHTVCQVIVLTGQTDYYFLLLVLKIVYPN